MKKRYIVLSLILLTIVGSLFTALSSNMFFDDIINIGVGLTNSTVFVTIPAITISAVFVILVLYILRTYQHPDCMKRITRLYLIITAVLGFLGALSSIMAGILVYGTFIGAHPFPGYLIIFLILNILLLCGSICGLYIIRKMKEDENRIKVNFKYVMKTIGWFLFISLMFNRFGMLLGSPIYIYLRNLNLTFPFYIYLLMPVYLGTLVALHKLEIGDRKKLFICGIVGLALNVCFFCYIVIVGMNDTGFISSLSQAMPLERAASKPVELPIHFLSYTGAGIAILLQNKKVKE